MKSKIDEQVQDMKEGVFFSIAYIWHVSLAGATCIIHANTEELPPSNIIFCPLNKSTARRDGPETIL